MSNLREKIEYAKGQYRDADEWEYQMFSANQSLLEWILDTEKSLTAERDRQSKEITLLREGLEKINSEQCKYADHMKRIARKTLATQQEISDGS